MSTIDAPPTGLPVGPPVAVTADELAALAWGFDGQAVVVDGPSVLDAVGDQRDVVAGSLLLSLATKGVIDLDVVEGEPRLRPVPELPALPAQLTRPERWIRLHRADAHGERTRHLLAVADRWLVVDVVGGLIVLATADHAAVGPLAAAALDPPPERSAADPGRATSDPPSAAGRGDLDTRERRRPTSEPPTGGCRGDLWACGPAGGRLNRRWRAWRDALGPAPRAAVEIDLRAVVDGTVVQDWSTVLLAGPTWWVADPDPDAAVVDPGPSLGDDDAPAVVGRADPGEVLGRLGHWAGAAAPLPAGVPYGG